MSQSLLNQCPVARRCCYCISLKLGTVLIAIAGLLPSPLLILFYEAGSSSFDQHWISSSAADAILHIYAVIGVLLFAVHVILLTAAITYNEKLILLYLWTCIGYIFIDSVLVTYFAVTAVLVQHFTFAAVYLLSQMCYWLFILVLVFPVVNGFRQSIHTVVIMINYAVCFIY